MIVGDIIELEREVTFRYTNGTWIFAEGCRFMITETREDNSVKAVDPWHVAFEFEKKEFRALKPSPFVQFKFGPQRERLIPSYIPVDK